MLVANALRCCALRRQSRIFHTARSCLATTQLTMPALSPTMTEGSITQWKVKEGDSFVAGDVLLQIETDKASIDVEAQDDGIMGKIVIPNDTTQVQVGQLIALLAEDGDDLSSIEVPSEATSSLSKPDSATSEPESSVSDGKKKPESSKEVSEGAESSRKSSGQTTVDSKSSGSQSPPTEHAHRDLPTHPKALLPSVLRTLVLANIKDASVIEATGFKGTLTKGDVLAYLGKIKNPRGSLKIETTETQQKVGEASSHPPKAQIQIDGPTLRAAIASQLSDKRRPPTSFSDESANAFEYVLNDYLPWSKSLAQPNYLSHVRSVEPSKLQPPPTIPRGQALNPSFDDIVLM